MVDRWPAASLAMRALIRKAKREELIEALRGGPKTLFRWSVERVCHRNMVEVLIYGSTMFDVEASSVEVLRVYARLYPFIDKIKENPSIP